MVISTHGAAPFKILSTVDVFSDDDKKEKFSSSCSHKLKFSVPIFRYDLSLGMELCGRESPYKAPRTSTIKHKNPLGKKIN